MKITRKSCPGTGTLGDLRLGGLLRCPVCGRYVTPTDRFWLPRHRPNKPSAVAKRLRRPRSERIREIFEIQHGDL